MVFSGNKNAYAHAIPMDESNFRRTYKKASHGDDVGHVINRSAEICIRAGVGLEPVLQEYTRAMEGGPGMPSRCAFGYFAVKARTKLEKLYDHLDRHALDKAAHGVALAQLLAIEALYCGENETCIHKCKFFHELGRVIELDECFIRNCPCKILETMVDGLLLALRD